MRKLSMKGKRGKSESGSDGNSEENGVGVKPQTDDDASAAHETSKIQKKNKRGRRSNIEADKDVDPTAPEHETNEQENGSPAKKRKKDTDQKASTSEDKSSEGEYEVQKVVGQRTIKGRRQFLVRWKGYDEDADTWEQEKNLNCPQLIEEYLTELAETSNNEKSSKSPKKTPRERKAAAAKSPAKSRKSGNKKKAVAAATNSKENKGEIEHGNGGDEESKEFEVEKIQDVRFHKKTKTRDFLIRWKGFSPAEDSWEPEENLNCPDLISRFMEKVEEARKTDPKELRTNPVHTKRYTLMSNDSGRRLSRRNVNKQRATYHQCDE